MAATFRVVRIEESPRWPSGDSRDIAMIRIRLTDLERRIGASLLTGDEPGMGRWWAAGLELVSGAPVEIIRYEGDPESQFVIRADANADGARVREEAMAALALDRAALLW